MILREVSAPRLRPVGLMPDGPPSGGSSSFEVIGSDDLPQSILPFDGAAPLSTTSYEQPGNLPSSHFTTSAVQYPAASTSTTSLISASSISLADLPPPPSITTSMGEQPGAAASSPDAAASTAMNAMVDLLASIPDAARDSTATQLNPPSQLPNSSACTPPTSQPTISAGLLAAPPPSASSSGGSFTMPPINHQQLFQHLES